MSWKASLSRHLPVIRFFACSKSPASRGVLNWYTKNYDELKRLNPCLPLLLRTHANAMPAITTELSFTTSHLLTYMLQYNKFLNPDGTPNQERRDAATKMLGYLNDKELQKEYKIARWNSPGFDPMRPFLEEEQPDWMEDPKLSKDLGRYIEIHTELENTWKVIQSGPKILGPNGEAGVSEYTAAENALLMCQRVDLWCAGEMEVEAAVKHLLNLGKSVNTGKNGLVPDLPEFVTEFYPGVGDLE